MSVAHTREVDITVVATDPAATHKRGGISHKPSVGILIGPEGGFSDAEIDDAIRAGGRAISLGRRILRTETAAITAVGMCMLHTEMHLTEERV